jgi:hypothetical protein
MDYLLDLFWSAGAFQLGINSDQGICEFQVELKIERFGWLEIDKDDARPGVPQRAD